jgi:multidrug efflux pump subunit AcrA (membrane-fusion protein)
VVNYSVKITFSTTDARIKPGMTVSAAIVSDIAQDVLTVPASAVKTRNGQSYVLVFDPALADSASSAGQTSDVAPTEKEVTVGLSDDSLTEITSGLSEGDQVVSRTMITTTTKTSSAPSAGSILGGTRTTGFSGGNATFRAGR